MDTDLAFLIAWKSLLGLVDRTECNSWSLAIADSHIEARVVALRAVEAAEAAERAERISSGVAEEPISVLRALCASEASD